MRPILSLAILFIATHLTAKTISIAVAANVSYAIDDLKKEFKKSNPDIDIKVTLGSSGKLTAQIRNGAPYQLFLSANMNYPKTLEKLNMTLTKPTIYAKGVLAIVSSKERDFSKGLSILLDDDIKKIAIANPKTAPYGQATMQALKNASIYETLKDKFIYGESISQTLSYTITATDLGIVAKSSLHSPKMSHFKEGKNWIELDTKLYTPINQGIVILKNAKNNREVETFYNFILGDKAKEIFKTYGYKLP
jgi:molybdate transport system substrate-binding protein